MKRAQVSMEYLVIFSFATLMLIPLILIYSIESANIKQEVTSAQSYKALSKITDSCEEIYFQGIPAKKTIRVSFPEGLSRVNVGDSYIEFIYMNENSEIPIIKDTAAKLQGEIRPFAGEHVIVITAHDTYVQLEDK